MYEPWAVVHPKYMKSFPWLLSLSIIFHFANSCTQLSTLDPTWTSLFLYNTSYEFLVLIKVPIIFSSAVADHFLWPNSDVGFASFYYALALENIIANLFQSILFIVVGSNFAYHQILISRSLRGTQFSSESKPCTVPIC